MTKTKKTNKNYELFKKECLLWVDRFGLNNWGLKFETIKGARNEKYLAYIRTDDDSMLASVFFNIETNEDRPIEDIKDTAKHEMIHLILARFSQLAKKRYAGADEIYSCEEELIQKFLKIIT